MLVVLGLACGSSLPPLETINALQPTEGGAWLVASEGRLSVLGPDGERRTGFEFPTDAKATLDGLAVGPGVIWGSGWVGGTVDTPGGPSHPRGQVDGFIAQWDDQLHLRWFKRLGTGGATLARRVALAADGSAWVVGTVTQRLGLDPGEASGDGSPDGFALHLDAHGAPLRQLRFASAGQDTARGVAIAADGAVAIVGQFGGPTEAHPTGAQDATHALVAGAHRLPHLGDADGFVLLLDREGVVTSATAIAEPGFDVVKDVRHTADGWLVVGSVKTEQGEAGHLLGTAPLRGFVAWLDSAGHLVQQHRPAGAISLHAIAGDELGWWSTGHAQDARSGRAMVLFRLRPEGATEVARCTGQGDTLGYAVAVAGRDVRFAGAATPPFRCTNATAGVSLPVASVTR